MARCGGPQHRKHSVGEQIPEFCQHLREVALECVSENDEVQKALGFCKIAESEKRSRWIAEHPVLCESSSHKWLMKIDAQDRVLANCSSIIVECDQEASLRSLILSKAKKSRAGAKLELTVVQASFLLACQSPTDVMSAWSGVSVLHQGAYTLCR